MNLLKVTLAGLSGLFLYAMARHATGATQVPGVPDLDPGPEPEPDLPTTTDLDPVAQVALTELERWQSRGLKEDSPDAQPILDRYWRSVGIGRQDPSVPWSAAFISYVTSIGAPGSLEPAAGHITYARSAFRRGGAPGTYMAFDPTLSPMVVRPGDILVFERSDSGVTFDDVRSGGAFFKSHGDVVVEVDGGRARTVGGNVSNDVSDKTVSLNPDGTVSSPMPFAILRRV